MSDRPRPDDIAAQITPGELREAAAVLRRFADNLDALASYLTPEKENPDE